MWINKSRSTRSIQDDWYTGLELPINTHKHMRYFQVKLVHDCVFIESVWWFTALSFWNMSERIRCFKRSLWVFMALFIHPSAFMFLWRPAALSLRPADIDSFCGFGFFACKDFPTEVVVIYSPLCGFKPTSCLFVCGTQKKKFCPITAYKSCQSSSKINKNTIKASQTSLKNQFTDNLLKRLIPLYMF